jgi:hypothetical protein
MTTESITAAIQGFESIAAAIQGFFQALDKMGLLTVFGSLGISAVVLATLKRYLDRMRWRRFKAAVHQWLDFLVAAERRQPRDLRNSEWQAECERMLVDAKFTPHEVVNLLDVSVTVAKAIAANKVFM